MDFRTAPHVKIKYVLQRYLFMLPNVHFSVCHSSFVITSGVTLLKGSWASDSAPISHDSTSSLWSSGFDLTSVLTHPGLLIGVCLPSTGSCSALLISQSCAKQVILSREPHPSFHLIQTCVSPHMTQSPKGRIGYLDLKVPLGPKKVHNPTQTNWSSTVEYDPPIKSNETCWPKTPQSNSSGGPRWRDHLLEGFYCNLTVTPIDVGQGSQGTQAGQREGKHPAGTDISHD